MYTLIRIVQTCHACPSQWDAWDDEGHYYYLRYRWGHGAVDRDGERIARFEYGDPLAGTISLEDFLSFTPEIQLAKGRGNV